MNRLFHLAIAWAGLAMGLAGHARAASVLVGAPLDEVKVSVPDPDNKGKCKTVVLGELGGQLNSDPLSLTFIAGFHKTYTGKTCFDTLHFLNIVVSDRSPPKVKGPDGKLTRVTPPYADPVSGGNIPPNGDQPQPPADGNPWYDGVQNNVPAGQTPELNLATQFSDFWTPTTNLDIVFGDQPTLTSGLEFVTILVGSHGKEICPIGGIAWGTNADGISHVDNVFSGNAYPGGLNTAGVQGALKASGFNGYTVEDQCCPCVPLPAGAWMSLIGLGMLGTGRATRWWMEKRAIAC